jgi:hypothetical protein
MDGSMHEIYVDIIETETAEGPLQHLRRGVQWWEQIRHVGHDVRFRLNDELVTGQSLI